MTAATVKNDVDVKRCKRMQFTDLPGGDSMVLVHSVVSTRGGLLKDGKKMKTTAAPLRTFHVVPGQQTATRESPAVSSYPAAAA